MSGYSGDAGDAIPRYSTGVANGMKFTTWDQDHEMHGANCATLADSNGDWWFKMSTKCHEERSQRTHMFWFAFKERFELEQRYMWGFVGLNQVSAHIADKV